MQTQLGIVLIRRDLDIAAVLDMLGATRADVLSCAAGPQRGVRAWLEARRLLSASPIPSEVLRVGTHGPWTAIADDLGDLTLDLQRWRRCAAALGTRVVVARLESDEAELVIFEGFEVRRLMSWAHGEELVQVGHAAPGEGPLVDAPPSLDRFKALLALWGVDLQALDERTDYALTLLRAGALRTAGQGEFVAEHDGAAGAGVAPDRALGHGRG